MLSRFEGAGDPGSRLLTRLSQTKRDAVVAATVPSEMVTLSDGDVGCGGAGN